MRHRAHRAAGRANACFGVSDEARNVGVVEIAHLPQRRRQIERPDEQQIDALDCEDGVDVFDSLD